MRFSLSIRQGSAATLLMGIALVVLLLMTVLERKREAK